MLGRDLDSQDSLRFNGAAVRGRRKLVVNPSAYPAECASMGPPSEDGGNVAPSTPTARRSRGFNGAAVRGRRKSVTWDSASSCSASASMGPPSEDGGNPRRRRNTRRWMRCFNGAAVRGRRKFETSAEAPSSSARFNGAAVRGRRKLGVGLVAGMPGKELQWGRRPRTAEIFYILLPLRKMKKLQWGRRPRTAEIQGRSSGTSTTPSLLQWGRRPRTAEMGREHLGGLPAGASMGPPSEDGGNLIYVVNATDGGIASMGPPSEDGGNTVVV